MKVALYMDSPYVGGAERHFADLCQGLTESDGIEVHALSPDSDLIPYLRNRLRGEVTIHVLASSRPSQSTATNLLRVVRAFPRLRATLRSLRPDILHIHNGGYPGSLVANSAVFATRVPRLMTVNNRAQPRRGGLRGSYRRLDRLVWAMVQRAIVPSMATADALVEHGRCPPSLINVIPYGIPAPAIDQVEVARLRRELAPQGDLVVGIVAAPTRGDPAASFKGHDVLLEAVGQLEREDVRLAIVGHDPGPAFARRADDFGLSDRISVFPGFRDAQPFMAAFDVLAVPSTRNEALPLVMLEAMASGTPVIGSRLSGIPEAVTDGENGYTFEPGDACELARIITGFAEDRAACHRLGQGARHTFLKHFESQLMVKRTVDVYEAAIHGH